MVVNTKTRDETLTDLRTERDVAKLWMSIYNREALKYRRICLALAIAAASEAVVILSAIIRESL